jgi:hypothetical protein
MIRAAAVFLSIVVSITPAAVFARGGSSGSHSSGSHSSGSHSSGSQYSIHSSYHSSRVSAHAGRVNVMDDHAVRSYYRKDGTYVQGYRATDPNNTTHDNYSTVGNVNPYTGKAGTKPDVRP